MAIPSTDCFVRLAAACHPNLPATVRAAALDAADDQIPSLVDAMANVHNARQILNAVLDSGSVGLVRKMTAVVAKTGDRGQGLLFGSDLPTWDGQASLDVGKLLVCAADDTALGTFVTITQTYKAYTQRTDFQSLLASLLMVDDGSWRPPGRGVQAQIAEQFLHHHSVWTRRTARKLYRERIRASVEMDVWVQALSDDTILTHHLGESIVATWLVWGTTRSPGIFQQAFGLSAHAAMGCTSLFPDWEEAQGVPQHRLERLFSPFIEQVRGLFPSQGIF